MTREEAKTATHEEAMKRFKIGNEDLTPVIQAARFGFDAGFDVALSLNQWVPVAERLPPTEEAEQCYFVTVYADGSDVRNGWQSGYYVEVTARFRTEDGQEHWGSESHAGYTVLAWQPYNEPAPYNKPQEGK